jgi:hypothetical protein
VASVFGCYNYCAIEMRAICFFLVLLSLVTTRSTYADASNDAKRDKAIVLEPGENRDRQLRPGMNAAPNVYLQ